MRRRTLVWRNPQERELRPLDQTIAETHRIVINQVIHATSISASTCPIRIIAYAGESDAVVTRVSANSVFPEVGVLPGDHFSIIRPDSHAHRSYAALKQHLREVLSAPGVPAPRPPAPRPPADGPRTDRRGELADRLLAVPRMADPAFREQLYALLPTVIVHQLRRDSAARIEIFALMDSFDHYRHLAPWHSLVTALETLVPHHPAVTEVAALAGADQPAPPTDG